MNTSADLESVNAGAIRSTKRKFHQAFLALDDAVNSKDTLDRLPPKRVHPSNSLYSTLAKYGIKSKDTKIQSPYDTEQLSRSTPNLSAILSRAASRTKKALPYRLGNQTKPILPLSTATEYRPSSISSFLSRLATYKLSTYANKPPAIDAVAAAKCGWLNDGKDRLVCGLCKSSWVVAGREGMTREAAHALLEKQRISLVDAHKNGCPWKRRQCDDSIYRVPLQPPAIMVKELRQTAIALDPLLSSIITRHPLTTKQLQSLRAITASLSSASLSSSYLGDKNSASRPTSPVQEDSEPSDSAILTALFGWSIASPSTLEASHRTPSSRACSVGPTPPRTPSVSRYPHSPKSPSSAFPNSSTLSLDKVLSSRNALLCCSLCQRRIGLWAFSARSTSGEHIAIPQDTSLDASPAGQRKFDLLKEHRSFCPYVVRSTAVPLPPIAAPSATNPNQLSIDGHERTTTSQVEIDSGILEGWRAVLTIVLRYGMKQRMAYAAFDSQADDQELEDREPMEVDTVKAMVNGVKSRGGRDLLKYVRSLLD